MPGDEMITVAAGFPTTVAPAVQYGVVPVFVDVTIPQYNIDAEKLEEALSPKTKVVMAAHTLGNPFDLKAVKAFCEKHNIPFSETQAGKSAIESSNYLNVGGIGAQYRRYRTRVSPMLETYVRG